MVVFFSIYDLNMVFYVVLILDLELLRVWYETDRHM